MGKREIARLAFKEILFTLTSLQIKFPDFHFKLPEFIEIDDEKFYSDDVFKISFSDYNDHLS